MVSYQKTQLSNGLTVIVHEDHSTPLAAVNVLYKVGSKNEKPDKTGFAHLFEHLMFEGSANIPNYDTPLYQAGGENNAFTSTDLTNYYCTLPANNVETAFWLESDRMLSLNFNEDSLKLQKSVVIEEFKETCFNQPYGDVWHKIQDLSYKEHPYKWPVIGKSIAHIEQATLADVKDFFFTYYRPNNAILTVTGDVQSATIFQLAEKWFGEIPSGANTDHSIAEEQVQRSFRHLSVQADVPVDAIYLAFHICKRTHKDYHATDMLNDLLASGSSSRLHQQLVKNKSLFTHITATMLGGMDKSLFFVYGKLAKGVSMTNAEKAIWMELNYLKKHPVDTYEIGKLKNKTESDIIFSEISLRSRAFYLAYFEALGDLREINNEVNKYLKVTPRDIQHIAQTIFQKANCSTLYYYAKMGQQQNK
ncbi:MAG: M16 family metallopeptidase [Chitinophagales bacterium]